MDQRGDHCWHKAPPDIHAYGFTVLCCNCGIFGCVPGDGPKAAKFINVQIPGHGTFIETRYLVEGEVILNSQRQVGKTCAEIKGKS